LGRGNETEKTTAKNEKRELFVEEGPSIKKRIKHGESKRPARKKRGKKN